jgi:hypothetical protein
VARLQGKVVQAVVQDNHLVGFDWNIHEINCGGQEGMAWQLSEEVLAEEKLDVL